MRLHQQNHIGLRIRRAAARLLAIGALMAPGGCFSAGEPRIVGGASAPAAPAEASSGGPVEIENAWRKPETWPRRWGFSPAAPGAKRAPLGIVEALKGPISALRQDEEQKREVEQEMLDDISKLIAARGRGWFRRTATLTVTGEGRGAYVFTTDRTAEPDRVKSPTEPALYFKFISGTRDESGETVRMQRTWFAYYDPIGYGQFDQGAPPACPGVAVVLPGLFGTPVSVVNQTVHALRSGGWAVVRMLSHPSRFTEQATFVLGDQTDVDGLAKTIADELGDRAAECAYSVEEVMNSVLDARPMLRGLPRLALGLSGGAMVLPTVVARNPEAYAGAVLIAGGADYLDIGLRSNYADWIDALRFRSSDGSHLAGPGAARLIAAYRAKAPLDPLYTVRALEGKPVLMIHALEDRAVPADLGDLLWERAGRPERWEYQVGHEVLFLSLPLQFPRLNRWLEMHIAARPKA